MYNDIEVSHAKKMDGGLPYSFEHTLWRVPPVNAFVSPAGLQLALASFQFRGAGTPEIGIGGRLDRNFWKCYLVSGAGALTDKTTEAQEATADDTPLEIAADNNSGFAIVSPHKFNCIALNIGVGSSGGSAVRTVEYSGPSGWVAIANCLVAAPTSGDWSTGEQLVWFTKPAAWTVMDAVNHAGYPVGLYGIRVRSTTAPTTTAAVASSLSVADIKSFKDLSAGNIFAWAPGIHPLHIDAPCDALVGVCTVANDSNQWAALVKMRG